MTCQRGSSGDWGSVSLRNDAPTITGPITRRIQLSERSTGDTTWNWTTSVRAFQVLAAFLQSSCKRGQCLMLMLQQQLDTRLQTKGGRKWSQLSHHCQNCQVRSGCVMWADELTQRIHAEKHWTQHYRTNVWLCIQFKHNLQLWHSGTWMRVSCVFSPGLWWYWFIFIGFPAPSACLRR